MEEVVKRSNKSFTPKDRRSESDDKPDHASPGLMIQTGSKVSEGKNDEGFNSVVPILQSEQELLNELLLRGDISNEEIDRMLKNSYIKESKRIVNYLKGLKSEREAINKPKVEFEWEVA